jgi:hypothetical protein
LKWLAVSQGLPHWERQAANHAIASQAVKSSNVLFEHYSSSSKCRSENMREDEQLLVSASSNAKSL